MKEKRKIKKIRYHEKTKGLERQSLIDLLFEAYELHARRIKDIKVWSKRCETSVAQKEK